AFAGASVGIALAVLVVGLALTATPPIAVCFAVMAGLAPSAYVRSKARRRRTELRTLWPDVVDDLASGVRAGLSLPEALIALAERGPEQLRGEFAMFARDYRASGRFVESIDLLKARLADPVADRPVEALRSTREGGGTDRGRRLRTRSQLRRRADRARRARSRAVARRVRAVRAPLPRQRPVRRVDRPAQGAVGRPGRRPPRRGAADHAGGRRHRPRAAAPHAVAVPPRRPPRPRRARGAAVVDGQRRPARGRGAVARARDARHPLDDDPGLQLARRRARAARRGGGVGARLPGDDAAGPAARGRAGAAMSAFTTPAGLTGAAAGLLLGVGLALVLWRLSARRIRLVDRVAPYLQERPTTSRLLQDTHVITPFPTLERIVRPVVRDVAGLLERLGSGASSIRTRLVRAGSPTTLEAFRTLQVIWATVDPA